MAKKLNSDQLMTAILSYLGILALIPFFVVKKKDKFIKFHLEQGINLLIWEIILSIVGVILPYIPFFGWIISLILSLIWLIILVFVIIAIIKAVSGNMWKIPLLGDIKIYKLK